MLPRPLIAFKDSLGFDFRVAFPRHDHRDAAVPTRPCDTRASSSSKFSHTSVQFFVSPHAFRKHLLLECLPCSACFFLFLFQLPCHLLSLSLHNVSDVVRVVSSRCTTNRGNDRFSSLRRQSQHVFGQWSRGTGGHWRPCECRFTLLGLTVPFSLFLREIMILFSFFPQVFMFSTHLRFCSLFAPHQLSVIRDPQNVARLASSQSSAPGLDGRRGVIPGPPLAVGARDTPGSGARSTPYGSSLGH